MDKFNYYINNKVRNMSEEDIFNKKNTNEELANSVDDSNKDSKKEKIKVKGDDLKPVNIFSYSIGHFLNDICASCWFNFLLYYLKSIMNYSATDSGLIMLVGQFADGLATPIIGVLSDKTESKFGKRTPWYVGGTIVSVICFTLIFQGDYVLPKDISHSVKIIYYCINCAVFNFGWAAVQVSHMSLLPGLSLSKKKQDKMTRLRTGFTFGAQLLSLLLSLLFFAVIDDKVLQYSILTLTCVGLGLLCSIVFLIYCKEALLSKNIKLYYDVIKDSINKRVDLNNPNSQELYESSYEDDQVADKKLEKIIDWKYWIKKYDFWAYMLVYMFVRLAINCSNSMIPFYCKHIFRWRNVDDSTPVQISVLMIICNVSSVLNSLFIENFLLSFFHKRNHRVVVFITSVSILMCGCTPLYFLNESYSYIGYIMAFIFGIGFSMGLSGASSLINDVIGSNGTKGAFVYGVYSFTDKVSCGVVMYFMIQVADNENDNNILKLFMSFFPTISIICALLVVFYKRFLKNNYDDGINKTRDKKQYGTILDNSQLTFV